MNFPTETDILIIGGGIVGLCVARELRRKGVDRVMILEKNSACGIEASHAAAGMLAPQAETNKIDDFFRFCEQGRDFYPNYAAEILEETGVNIELDQTGTLYLAFNEDEANELETRFVWQKSANLDVERLSPSEVLELEPDISPDVLFGLRFANDWQVENRKLVEALVNSCRQLGVEFIHETSVENLLESDGKVFGVRTNNGEIQAKNIVVASGAWTSLIQDNFGLLSEIKVTPIRGQMLAFSDKLFRHIIYSPRGYIVPRQDWRMLVGATTENVGFDNRTTGAGVASLLEMAFEISPKFENLSLKNSWSGLRPKVADGLPVLGEITGIENLILATAHFRNGILLAPITGKIIAEKIVDGKESPFLNEFSASRFFNKRFIAMSEVN